MYKLNNVVPSNCVIRISDGASIHENSQEYLAWLKNGNLPLPADNVVALGKTSLEEATIFLLKSVMIAEADIKQRDELLSKLEGK